MSLTADGRTGYYATYKEDSRGGNDLYKIFPIDRIFINDTLVDTTVAIVEPIDTTPVQNLVDNTPKEETKPVEAIKPIEYKSTISIKVVDEKGIPILANIEIHPKGSTETLKSGQTSSGLFSFAHTFSKTEQLLITAEAKDYFFQNQDFTLMTSDDGKTKSLTVVMKKAKQMEIRPLRNVYFGFDKVTLTPASYIEIDKLYNMMKNSPNMYIEIAGHTDFLGSDAYNKDLSQKRANAVKNALVKKGISAERIKAVGYGEEHPLATNDDESEGRELNRRTEFIIIPH
jgi:outer membrane protein OmpA-like peptidoglycan-associated protein